MFEALLEGSQDSGVLLLHEASTGHGRMRTHTAVAAVAIPGPRELLYIALFGQKTLRNSMKFNEIHGISGRNEPKGMVSDLNCGPFL